VTIFAMRLLAAAVTAAVVLPACGTGSGSDESLRKADDALAAAERSLTAVDDLKEEVSALENRLDDARRKGAALSSRLDKATQKLWDSLARVRTSVSDAAGSASSALASAQSAARDIAVLTQRFDYHLRQSGGG
jgi:predicted  nucleic acid-binding Zn-ribbon protein